MRYKGFLPCALLLLVGCGSGGADENSERAASPVTAEVLDCRYDSEVRTLTMSLSINFPSNPPSPQPLIPNTLLRVKARDTQGESEITVWELYPSKGEPKATLILRRLPDLPDSLEIVGLTFLTREPRSIRAPSLGELAGQSIDFPGGRVEVKGARIVRQAAQIAISFEALQLPDWLQISGTEEETLRLDGRTLPTVKREILPANGGIVQGVEFDVGGKKRHASAVLTIRAWSFSLENPILLGNLSSRCGE